MPAHKVKLVLETQPDGCIHCTSHKTNTKGYTQIWDAKTNGMRLLHRVLYAEVLGPIPPGMEVMHSCDNPQCVNLDHLSLGTHAENIRDASRKGRLAPTRGESSGTAKLTELQVRRIRESVATQKELAREYEVTTQCISLIRNRRTWKHLP